MTSEHIECKQYISQVLLQVRHASEEHTVQCSLHKALDWETLCEYTYSCLFLKLLVKLASFLGPAEWGSWNKVSNKSTVVCTICLFQLTIQRVNCLVVPVGDRLQRFTTFFIKVSWVIQICVVTYNHWSYCIALKVQYMLANMPWYNCIGSLNFNEKDYHKYGTEDVHVYNKNLFPNNVSGNPQNNQSISKNIW